MSSPPLRVVWEDGCCTLTLDRPMSGNALSAELVASIDDALAAATARRASMLVLRGEGRHFCAGFDLSSLESETDDSLLARFVRVEIMLQRIAAASFPTVAIVQGRVMGAGADMFTACSTRLIAGDAAFAFPGWKGFGIVLGSSRLAGLVGAPTALDWIHSGRLITAQEAMATGLANGIGESPAALAPSLRAAIRTRPTTNSGEDVGCLLTFAVQGPLATNAQRDLQALVHSAIKPGLRERIARYSQSAASARRSSATPPQST